MVFAKKLMPEALHYEELDDGRMELFVKLLDTIKGEAGMAAQEFRSIRVNKKNSQEGNTMVGLYRQRVDDVIAELNLLRKHLAITTRRAVDMIVMLNRATH